MKVHSKVTKNWWMIFKPFPPEPHGLWKLYTLSLLVTLLLLFIAGFGALSKHGWGKEPSINEPPINVEIWGWKCKCPEQKGFWEKLLTDAEKNSSVAKARLQLLEKFRSDPKDKNFGKSWSWFETEINQLKEVINKPQKHRVASLSKTFILLILFVFFSLIFYIIVYRLILIHAKSIQYYFNVDKSHNFIYEWVLPEILFGVLIAISMISAEFLTSVLATEKTAFGWDSFCVTPDAFIVKELALISFGFVAAAPFTMLWCLSRINYIPKPDPDARDGKFGGGRYVEFLQTWTWWLILAPSTLGILWIQFIGKKEIFLYPARLLHGLGVGFIVIIIILKMIRNAIILRFRCYETLLTIKYDNIDMIPKDPTIDFLGTNWWKLPATVSVSLVSIWAILEWFGIAKSIKDIFG